MAPHRSSVLMAAAVLLVGSIQVQGDDEACLSQIYSCMDPYCIQNYCPAISMNTRDAVRLCPGILERLKCVNETIYEEDCDSVSDAVKEIINENIVVRFAERLCSGLLCPSKLEQCFAISGFPTLSFTPITEILEQPSLNALCGEYNDVLDCFDDLEQVRESWMCPASTDTDEEKARLQNFASQMQDPTSGCGIERTNNDDNVCPYRPPATGVGNCAYAPSECDTNAECPRGQACCSYGCGSNRKCVPAAAKKFWVN